MRYKGLPFLVCLVVLGSAPVLTSWADWREKVPFLDKSRAAETAAPATTPTGGRRGGQEGKTALVRILDKQTNRLQVIAGAVGTDLTGAPLRVTVGRCVKSIEGRPGQDAAWLTMAPLGGGERFFEGWMFSTYPEVSALDHPRYDVQLVACDKERPEQVGTVMPVIQINELPAGRDDEAPPSDSSPANDATDPYFIPGVGAGTVFTPANAEAEMPVAPTPSTPEMPVDALHDLMDRQ
ncbi:MAG: hypothetical protein COY40_03410 [Alphaproteobacteria bacterium CG_4_10_14_0_8_um_filter_53_9]|nr:MAG: hypothetical protein COY40_03410 [Alphaproteobacteria bacterium CG_4_10_14_0_8_um_filter_53_9]